MWDRPLPLDRQAREALRYFHPRWRTSSGYSFGHFEFDQATFRLLKSGVPVPVEPKALDLLQVLLARAPRVVDKAEIFSIVWKDVAVTDNALTRAIAQLEKSAGGRLEGAPVYRDRGDPRLPIRRRRFRCSRLDAR